ncbi:MAG: hypothetical protein CMH64_02690 [Nanoarchaeota archaeon]|nr:hypothetical protein [Nanoarchaeota archaeon]
MNRIELDGLVIGFNGGDIEIKHSPDEIFHTLNSGFLETYREEVIDPELFDDNASSQSMSEPYEANYRRFLGPRNIHLGNLGMTGFLNPNYDVSFCFDLPYILSLPNRICDHDIFVQALLYGVDHPIKKIFKKTYEVGDEVLVRKLDLKEAKKAFYYSEGAESNLTQFSSLEGDKKYDLSSIRTVAIGL